MTTTSSARRLVVLTHFPSPYQVELFNTIEQRRPGWLHVLYLFRSLRSRSWHEAAPQHSYQYLDECAAGMQAAREDMATAAYVVFNYYNDSRAAKLIRARVQSGLSWCFWGERPGFRHPWLARVARLGRLGALRSGDQPIWGIGGWAVDAYKHEFGPSHRYINMPYYSDLSRFQAARPTFSTGQVRFLFSGAVSHRKGIDLLAKAFARLSAVNARVHLTIMGEGPLHPRVREILGTAGSVEWLGFKDWDQLPPAYAASHILCVPSRHDGWGLVVPEGLASGLPTISTDRTGAALDLIRHGDNGWIVPAGDGEALYGAMAQAAALSGEEWARMSAAASASVAGHSLEHGAMRFLDAIDQSVAAGQAPA